MPNLDLIDWLSEALPSILDKPIDDGQRIQSSRELVEAFAQKISHASQEGNATA